MRKNLGILLVLMMVFCKSSLCQSVFIYVDKSFHGEENGARFTPFSSIAAAFDSLSKIKSGKGINIEIAISEGTYYLSKTIDIQHLEFASLKIHALPNHKVNISGGTVLNNNALETYDGPSNSEKKYKYYRYNLIKAGITNFGIHYSNGFRRPYRPSAMELFVDNNPFSIARYPNKNEMLPMGKVLEIGSKPAYYDFSNKGGKFVLDDDRLTIWKREKNGWIGGYFSFAWADDAFSIEEIDLENKTITTSGAAMFGFVSGNSWSKVYVYNMLSELDYPGEYFVDKEDGWLYFCTEEDIIDKEMSISILESPLFSIKGVHNLLIENLTFQDTRGMAVYMEKSENCILRSCTFKNIGMVGVVIGKGIEPFNVYKEKGTGRAVSDTLGSWHEHIYNNSAFVRDAGRNNGIDNCHFYNIGMGAISLGGGDRKTLSDGRNFVINSKIHDFNRLGKTYKAGINVDGCGNIIKNNEIYNAEHSGIYLHGNNHVIEGNNIYKCCTNTEDMGAIYMGRDPSEAGNIIRYNYFHEITPAEKNYRVSAIFLDDGASYTNIEGNIFENCGDQVFGACYSNSGQFLQYTNNLFLNCEKAIGYHRWDDNFWKTYYEGALWQDRLFKTVDIRKEPYRSRYPELSTKLQFQQAPPTIRACILVNCKVLIDPHVIAIRNLVLSKKNMDIRDYKITGMSLKKLPNWARRLKFDEIIQQASRAGNNAGNKYETTSISSTKIGAR